MKVIELPKNVFFIQSVYNGIGISLFVSYQVTANYDQPRMTSEKTKIKQVIFIEYLLKLNIIIV